METTFRCRNTSARSYQLSHSLRKRIEWKLYLIKDTWVVEGLSHSLRKRIEWKPAMGLKEPANARFFLTR